MESCVQPLVPDFGAERLLVPPVQFVLFRPHADAPRLPLRGGRRLNGVHGGFASGTQQRNGLWFEQKLSSTWKESKGEPVLFGAWEPVKIPATPVRKLEPNAATSLIESNWHIRTSRLGDEGKCGDVAGKRVTRWSRSASRYSRSNSRRFEMRLTPACTAPRT